MDWQKRRIDKGLCKRCGKPRTTKHHCQQCARIYSRNHSKRLSKRNRERVERGVCVRCEGKLADNSTWYCQHHLEYQREAIRLHNKRTRQKEAALSSNTITP